MESETAEQRAAWNILCLADHGRKNYGRGMGCWANGTLERIVETNGGFEQSFECGMGPSLTCGLGLCAEHCNEIH
jgi:hypothetical protein